MKVIKKLNLLNELTMLVCIFFFVCTISLIGIGIMYDLINRTSLSAPRRDPIFRNLNTVLIVWGVLEILLMVAQLVMSNMAANIINEVAENVEQKFAKALKWSRFLPFGLLQLYCYHKIKLVTQTDNI